MTKAELESKHLAELHALAAEAGVPRYRMLPREELVEALAGSSEAASPSREPEAPAPRRPAPRERTRPAAPPRQARRRRRAARASTPPQAPPPALRPQGRQGRPPRVRRPLAGGLERARPRGDRLLLRRGRRVRHPRGCQRLPRGEVPRPRGAAHPLSPRPRAGAEPGRHRGVPARRPRRLRDPLPARGRPPGDRGGRAGRVRAGGPGPRLLRARAGLSAVPRYGR